MQPQVVGPDPRRFGWTRVCCPGPPHMSPLLQKHAFGAAAQAWLGWNRRYLGQRRAVAETGTGAGWRIKTAPEPFMVAAGDLFPHKREGMREIKKDREWREEIKANS